jgi:hypothetical protein
LDFGTRVKYVRCDRFTALQKLAEVPAAAQQQIAPKDSFKVTGDVRFFDKPADSGNIASRGFCPNCGSPIYSTNSGFPGLVFVRASTLDDPEVFHPQMVVYTSRAEYLVQTGNPPTFFLYSISRESGQHAPLVLCDLDKSHICCKTNTSGSRWRNGVSHALYHASTNLS